MSKKLYYGGKEVVANDPRLPEILADIVTLIDRALDKKVTISGMEVVDIAPSRYYEPSDEVLSRMEEQKTVFALHDVPVFKYKGEIHPNLDDVPAAECIKRPGFKVVEGK